jgi:hypothetical protein
VKSHGGEQLWGTMNSNIGQVIGRKEAPACRRGALLEKPQALMET